MTVYCDANECEYNEDGCFCKKESISVKDMFCNSNEIKTEPEENDDE